MPAPTMRPACTSVTPRRSTVASILRAALLPAMAVALLAAPPVHAQEAPAELTDPEIAHVAVTANAVDVEMAEFALPRITGPRVEAFARGMISAHTGVIERAAALAERLGVVPRDNAVSRSLRSGADQARSQLEGATGTAFDRAYMEREVAYHQAVLEALDDLLIPGTDNGDLRALLEEVRPVIAAHHEQAETILSGLE